MDLFAPGHRQRIRGHLFGDGRSRPDDGVPFDLDGSYKGRIASDEDPIFDDCGMLLLPVIIASDGPGADVDLLSQGGIPDVGEVIGLGPFADDRFLDLYKVTDPRAFPQKGPGAQMVR